MGSFSFAAIEQAIKNPARGALQCQLRTLQSINTSFLIAYRFTESANELGTTATVGFLLEG